MKLQLVTAPSLYPVSLAEAKKHLRVTGTDDDALIYRYIGAAVLWVEQYLGRKLVTQTWKYYLDGFPSANYLPIPFGNLQSITHIKYTDTDGTQSTFSTDDYSTDTVSVPGRAVLDYGETWPSDTLQTNSPIEIQFVTGYTYNATVSEDVFDGVGLDDLASGGAYTGTTPAVFEVEMQTAATPDTFRWRKNRGAWTSGVAVTGAAQNLSDGVTVTFGATTGHTVGEGWEFFAGLTVPEDIRNAIFLMVGHFYENRESTIPSSVVLTTIPLGVEALLYPHRIWEWRT